MLLFNSQLNTRRFLALCLFAVVAFGSIKANAQQRLHQEVYGTLFNTGVYHTEDVYARQFHDRSAIAGNKLRLTNIAEAFYNGGVWHNMNDSTSLVYSGVRGWDSVLDEWAYDTLNNFIVSLPMWREYGNDGRVSMNYYAFNQNLPQRRVFTYASNGKLATYKYEELKNGTQWVTLTEYNYSYDATYRRIHQASDDEAIAYNYGINNLQSIEISKKTNGTFKFSNGMYYHYDTIDGRLREVIHSVRLLNGDPYETGRTAYAYDWNGKATTMYLITNKSLLVKDTIKVSYTYNDSGYISTILTQKVAKGVDSNLRRVEIKYNYVHQVISEKSQYWSKSAELWMYDKEKRYHYQTIWPVNVAEKQPGSTPEVQLYPVPAKERITVSVSNAGRGNMELTLVNMNGVVLRKWSYRNMGNSYKQELQIGDLPTGNYMMRIETEAGVVTKPLVLQ